MGALVCVAVVGRLRENYWFKEEVGAVSENTHFGTFDIKFLHFFSPPICQTIYTAALCSRSEVKVTV